MLTRPIVGRTEASSSSPGARFLLDKFVTSTGGSGRTSCACVCVLNLCQVRQKTIIIYE